MPSPSSLCQMCADVVFPSVLCQSPLASTVGTRVALLSFPAAGILCDIVIVHDCFFHCASFKFDLT